MWHEAGLHTIRRYGNRVLCYYKGWILQGLRPFGVSLLYAGYDVQYNFQLYHSDPSGNYSGWKATCIGANNGTAQSLLKQEYKDDITVEDAIGLAIRVMGKTMDSTTLGSEKRQYNLYFEMSLSYIYFQSNLLSWLLIRKQKNHMPRYTSLRK